MAHFHFYTYDHLQDWLKKNPGKGYRRGSLLKTWKKWREGALPELQAVLCDHRDQAGNLKVKDWDCGCSWGCESCNITVRCETCGFGFENAKVATNLLSCSLVGP